jgi:hypothetical protein
LGRPLIIVLLLASSRRNYAWRLRGRLRRLLLRLGLRLFRMLLVAGWRNYAGLLRRRLLRLRLCLFRMLLVASRWKSCLVARFFAGLFFWSLRVFIGRQILWRRRFARYILDRSWFQRFSRRVFNGIYTGTFVGVDGSFLSINLDRFAFEISNRPCFVDDRCVVNNQIAGTERGAEAVYANEHKE